MLGPLGLYYWGPYDDVLLHSLLGRGEVRGLGFVWELYCPPTVPWERFLSCAQNGAVSGTVCADSIW